MNKSTPYATSYETNIIEAVAVDDIDYNFGSNTSPVSGMDTTGRSLNRAASMSWPVVNEGQLTILCDRFEDDNILFDK